MNDVAFTDHSECAALMSVVQTAGSTPAGARRRWLKRGQRLWLSEAPFDCIYRLEQGQLSILGADGAGRELLLRTVASGDWFGDYCLCPAQQLPHPVLEARADQDCRLTEIRQDRWMRDLIGNAAAVREFVNQTCLRLAQADRRLIMMARRSADERIGLLLLELAAADRLPDLPRAPRVTQTHAELAQAAAMARPHVSVTLGRFRRKGLISYRRHEAIVVNVDRLRSYLDRFETERASPPRSV